MFRPFLILIVTVFLVSSLALTALFGLRSSDPRPLLAFARIGPPSNIWLLDLDSQREYQLPDTEGGLNPTWSPDGRWLAYVKRLADGFGSLYAANLLTGDNQFVSPDATLSPPDWSPDSQWLVVYSGDESSAFLSYAQVTSKIISRVHALDNAEPSVIWSPDSQHVLYLDFSGNVVILPPSCLPDPACPDARRLQPERPLNTLLGWMPDARLMVSAPLEQSGRPYLHALDLATGQLTRYMDDPPLTEPVWTADESALAFPVIKSEDYGLFIVKTQVAELVLVDGQTGQQTHVWDGVTGHLSWTPDGNMLAYEATTARPSQQYRALQLYDRRAGSITRLTAGGLVEATPAWGVFRGREFAGGALLILDAALALVLMAPGLVKHRLKIRKDLTQRTLRNKVSTNAKSFFLSVLSVVQIFSLFFRHLCGLKS